MKEVVLTAANTKNLYQNCQDTTLDVWLTIMQTKSPVHIVKKGVAPSPEIMEAQIEKINKEFLALRGQSDAIIQYDKIQYKRQLEMRVTLCSSVVNLMVRRMTFNLMTVEHLDKYVHRLKVLGFRINKDNPLNDELDIITSELQALQTTISILHEELYPEREEEAEEEEKKVFAFYDMLLTYQRILDIGTIDTQKTSLMQFSVLEKQVEKKISKRTPNMN